MTKLLSCRYNMDTNRVEARFADGSTLAIDCIAIEDEYGNTPTRRAELDWLLASAIVCSECGIGCSNFNALINRIISHLAVTMAY